jgi:hypothetical protein
MEDQPVQRQLERGIHESLGPKGLAFVSWMNKNNFDIHPNVQLRYTDAYQGHGVFASGKIECDAKLFQVPKSCMMTWMTSALRRRMPKLKLPGWNRLILAMMYENSLSSSFWRPYLDILPMKLNTPVFWTEDQLECLSGCSIQEHIGAKKILSDYNKHIVPLLTKAELYPQGKPSSSIKEEFFSFDQYRRFGSLIMAYSFSDDDGDIAMVPMADMLNHKTGSNNARLYFDQEDGSIHQEEKGKKDDEIGGNDGILKKDEKVPSSSSSLVNALVPPSKKPKKSEKNYLHMRSRRAIEAEEELYNTYGNLPDSELLRKYGYCEELGKNRWNDIEIPVSLVISEASSACGWGPLEVAKRRKFIKSNNLVDPDASLVFHLHQEPFGPLDPLDMADANEADEEGDENPTIKGGLSKDILSIAKIFAASPSDWTVAEKAILESIASSSSANDQDDDQEDEESGEDDRNPNGLDGNEPKPEPETNPNNGPIDPSSPSVPKKKRGGDLIHIADPNLLAKIVKQVIQSKIDSYGPPSLASSLLRLDELPTPSPSSPITEDIIRTRCALIVRAGELQLLETLLAEASLLSSPTTEI